MTIDVPFTAEPITIVRLAQPRCARTFGVAPCTATGEACFNTRATCRDPANFSGTATLDLWFGAPGAGRPSDDLYLLPLLVSVSTSPAKLNVSGADRGANPLGIRGTATIRLRDMAHNDRLVDPYLATRSYDPLTRGTFWGKWSRRNLYGRAGMIVTVYEGYAGDALAAMTRRTYVAESLDASGADLVTLRARDLLSKASDEKALAPRPSPGELAADITAAQTTLSVSGATTADYAASGTLRIGDEVMKYSARTLNGGTGLLDFTISARGSDKTTAEEHKSGDRVQQCLRFSSLAVDAALAALYQGYTTIPTAYLDLAAWAAEAADHLTAYSVTGLVTDPTPVKDLIGEICEQAQVMQWWDERAALVKMRAIAPLDAEPRRVTEAEHILAESVALREFPDRRVSQVWVYYDPRDPTANPRAAESYRRAQVSAELTLEGADLFGDPAIRTVFARFINSTPVALETSARILSRYKNGATEIAFSVTDKDGDLEVAEVVKIRHHLIQDATGAPQERLWVITSADRRHRERRVTYTAEDATLAGTLYRICANTVPDYRGDGSDPFDAAFVSITSTGLLPNGDPGMTIQ
ncbi:hypothetical protein R5H32_16115 [Defluviimonas sp. D31]|uniref:hypothetical protein n=1 Tax=Defluviimonas sp. D31 TaxID=3083253 RepID=UPI002970027B|nr:hypothetical protein [Defluviimonas sp. D31]MDW4550888.1 hypothetical protein [Defluviimonas sp. D31]